MLIEHTQVFGFQAALRGMRNPHDSWRKGDSAFYAVCHPPKDGIDCPEQPIIGSDDMRLATSLIGKGSPHEKFLRQIIIWVDLTLPIFVWSEFDTYKVATVRNSCSTMNMLGKRDLEQSDFELPITDTALADLNVLGNVFRSGDVSKRDMRVQLKNDLPSGYLQKATLTFSYATAVSMFHQRKNHRLAQWRMESPGSLCEWLLSLPYMFEFCGSVK